MKIFNVSYLYFSDCVNPVVFLPAAWMKWFLHGIILKSNKQNSIQPNSIVIFQSIDCIYFEKWLKLSKTFIKYILNFKCNYRSTLIKLFFSSNTYFFFYIISPNINPRALAALTRTAMTSSCSNTAILWLKYSAECCWWLEPECKLYNSPTIQAAFPRISDHWLFRCGKVDSIKSETCSPRSSV